MVAARHLDWTVSLEPLSGGPQRLYCAGFLLVSIPVLERENSLVNGEKLESF